jgi:hypothetical protein
LLGRSFKQVWWRPIASIFIVDWAGSWQDSASPFFHGVDSTLASVSGLLLLLVALALYDMFSRKRVHAATLLGGSFLMGTRILSIFVVATSELGRSFIRGLG